LINVKCDEYGINKNHVIETNKIGKRLYLSEHERREYVKKLEKAAKTDMFVNKNFDKLMHNILGTSTKQKT
jgi:hypothetical protein